MSKKDPLSFFKKFILKQGLGRKLSLLVVGVLLIPIIIIDVISISMSVNSVINESKKSYLAATEANSHYFQLVFETVRDLAMQLMSNDVIQKLYSESRQLTLEDYEKYKLKNDADKMLQNIFLTNQMLSKAYILVNKDNSLAYPYFSVEDLDFNKLKSASWYKKIIEKDGPIYLENHHEALDELSPTIPQYAFSVGLPFKDLSSSETLGVLMLDVSLLWFRNALQSTNISQQGGYMLAVSPSGKVILPSEWETTRKLSPKADTPFIKKILAEAKGKNPKGAFNTVFDGKPFLVTYSRIPEQEWIIVSMIPVEMLLSSARKLELFVIVLTIIFTLAALAVGIFFALRMVKDLELVTNTFAVAEKGDLTVALNIERNDEIGFLSHSFNNMIKNIKGLIEKGVKLSDQVTSSISTLSTIAGETAAASNEVAKAISEIAEGASNQAKEATNVVEIVSKFGEKVETIVDASNKMEKLSKNVAELSTKGENTVSILDSVSHDTMQITDTMISTINQLAEYSRSIGKIIQVLSSISEQTKLLALNASIEAAKAGEAGRGFAVVASEIRKLADQSKESTREVEDMIKRIVSQTKAAQDVADKVEDVIEKQNEAVRNVSLAFSSIKSAMDELIDGIENINQSILAIDKEKDTIVRSIENISAISQETAASSEEVSASTQEQLAAIEELRAMAESLNKLAQDLKEAMQVFKV
ncbi:methyl-accepting chemotaxis sensory transducer [Caldicellulosiruptor hydrothermalis 108]|uniref:Methyl-accepting chemotaxis sensory transducer n=1 Tax=Caldicellulosiruptor hydrothermalis (strain DSM 18901 / VKM B-2411 / 108) TaxID=632292 RepID=E4QC27_CALH1|nr:methyl-accepting chemotaxis protein [Caldicellulosiruptor hydrothermalis]ADQ06201.1 methyl-accepting chemotaxis sensory transducer [Caldicellulosiruptor hydrothermalis 108]